MFLLHPSVGQLLNLRSIHTPFATEGLMGSVKSVLHAQQANRLLAVGQQCLASSGGTASLCGGAAGPGGGMAGASCASFSGSTAVAAGGSNGAAGGVPVGGQEIARYYVDIWGAWATSPYIEDNLAEIDPLLLGSGGFLRRSGSSGSGKQSSGVGSHGGAGTTNGMPAMGNNPGHDVTPPSGCPTCPQPPTH